MSNKKIPKDYFEKLPDRILSKINDAKVSESIIESTPYLDSISRANPYRVPDNYFSSVLYRASSGQKVKFLRLKKALSIAAAFVTIISATWIAYPTIGEESYTTEEAIAYYINNVDMIDDDLYIEDEIAEDIILEEQTDEEILLMELLEELSYLELDELQSELY